MMALLTIATIVLSSLCLARGLMWAFPDFFEDHDDELALRITLIGAGFIVWGVWEAAL